MWSLPLRMIWFALAAFVLLRLGLLWAYPEHFADLSLWQKAGAFAQGLRFDGQLAVLAFAPFLLLLMIPWPRLQRRGFRKTVSWLAAAVLAVLLGIGVADLAYFGEVGRHLGGELFNLGGDWGFVWQAAVSSRLGHTLGGLAMLLLAGWLWQRLVAGKAVAWNGTWRRGAVQSCLLLVCLVLAARGTLGGGKPLSTIDAFKGQTLAQANLAINGPLAALKAGDQQAAPLDLLSAEEMAAVARTQPAQPFLYRPASNAPSGKNVVFILLESWSSRYIDGLAGSAYGATPYLDSLIARAQVWDRFYAAGQRSIVGIQAALTAVPALPGQPNLGFGLEVNRMSRIAALADAHGYRTLMAQSSKRRSFYMDGIAHALGFREYYGMEDVPLLRSYAEQAPYGWDYDTLQFVGRKLSEGRQPFFAFVFTGTTHEPFADPGREFHLAPHQSSGEQGFLNTLRYSDWALQEFMAYAEQQSWYRNTVFVISADHTLNAGPGGQGAEAFHIPLLIFAPDGSLPPQRHSRLASQYDLLPTFIDLLGWNEPVSAFGHSLLRPDSQQPLMMTKGDISVMLAEGAYAEFNRRHLLTEEGGDAAPQRRLLQWRMQTADTLLRQNRWAEE